MPNINDRNMTDRYPELEKCCYEELIIDQNQTFELLEPAYTKLVEQYPILDELVLELNEIKDIHSLNNVCQFLFSTIEMKDNHGNLNPLISTREQLERYGSDSFDGFGDCKLLTILTAYICNINAEIPPNISVRNHSGHPVLFIQINNIPYKISFLHEFCEIKEFTGEDPFVLSEQQRFDPSFIDEDFPGDRLILYWDVNSAMFVLDCINILRRCVVNYVLDPQKYDVIFNEVITILNNSGVYHNSIAHYWEQEFDRVKDILSYNPSVSSDIIRNIIIKSLRFN